MKYLRYTLKRLTSGANKSDFIRYPLVREPSDLKLHADHLRKSSVLRLVNKLRDGTYRRQTNACLCGNRDASLDELVSKLEMHGVSHEILLCWKRGLIRSAEVLDEKSNTNYYQFEYREIISGGKTGVETFFNAQLERGNHFVKILEECKVIDRIQSVAEIGCGCGGILFPFHSIGRNVSGYDYDEDYLEYGRHKGMRMFNIGTAAGPVPQDSPDILILSHVLEHFLNPIAELTRYIDTVKHGGYLLVEVPGIFSTSDKSKLHGYPVRFFQFAHVFQFFYRRYLEVFYKAFGLEIIYGDETATFVLRKPFHWKRIAPDIIFDDQLRSYPPLIDSYLKETFFDYRHAPNRENAKWLLSSLLERIGFRSALKKLMNR